MPLLAFRITLIVPDHYLVSCTPSLGVYSKIEVSYIDVLKDIYLLDFFKLRDWSLTMRTILLHRVKSERAFSCNQSDNAGNCTKRMMRCCKEYHYHNSTEFYRSPSLSFSSKARLSTLYPSLEVVKLFPQDFLGGLVRGYDSF